MTAFTINHLHIICDDLENMKRFWTDGMGASFSEDRRFGGAEGAVLQLGKLQINLRVPKTSEHEMAPNTPTLGYDHLGFEVDDLESACAHLAAFGCRITSGPTQLTDRKIVFLSGPEDITLELVQFQH